MKEKHRILLRPLITEKSTDIKEQGNQVIFEVSPSANKIEISKAVESAFSVQVLKVRTINVKGKKRRIGRYLGTRSDWKKAVVTLAPEDNIQFFDGV